MFKTNCNRPGTFLFTALLATCIYAAVAVRIGPDNPNVHNDRGEGALDGLVQSTAGSSRRLQQASTPAGVVSAAVAVTSFATQLFNKDVDQHMGPQIHPAADRYQCLKKEKEVGYSLPVPGPFGAPRGGYDKACHSQTKRSDTVVTKECDGSDDEYWEIMAGDDYMRHNAGWGRESFLAAAEDGDHVCSIDQGELENDKLQNWDIRFLKCTGDGISYAGSGKRVYDCGDTCVRCKDCEWEWEWNGWFPSRVCKECKDPGEGVFQIESLCQWRHDKCLRFNGDGEDVTLADCDASDLNQLWYVPSTPDFNEPEPEQCKK